MCERVFPGMRAYSYCFAHDSVPSQNSIFPTLRSTQLRTIRLETQRSYFSISRLHGSLSTAAITKPESSLATEVGSTVSTDQGIVTDAADLFPRTNAPQRELSLILYFPIGVGVAALRILLWVVLLIVDQPWLTDNDTSIAVLQAILGIKVVWENAAAIPEGRHVLVSNHVTTGDLMALYRRPRRVVHLISTALPKRIAQAEHHRVDLRHACLEMYDALARHDTAESIHLFPEGGMTNGRGMMKFSRGFLRFADGAPVVPVALRASLPWDLSTHTLTSSFLSNLFWFCFSPYVTLHMTVLPPMQRRRGESKARFVARIQESIAEELRIPILDFTIQAKKKLMQSALKSQR